MTRTTRLCVSLGINLALTGGLLLAGRAAHSTGLVADAGHNLTDAVAILVALLASLLALRPATERRSFGYHRATILAALTNGVVLVLVTFSIAWMALYRLLHPQPVHGGIIVVAASLSIVANLGVVWLLTEGHEDLSMRSVLIHSLGDALASAVVAISGIIALVASGPITERVDPIASLIVAGVIVLEAFRITRSSLHVLLEGVPSDIELSDVRERLTAITGIREVHDLHVWSLSSSHRALSAHMVVDGDPTVSAAGHLLSKARALLEDEFRIDHATIELEAASCADEHPHP